MKIRNLRSIVKLVVGVALVIAGVAVIANAQQTAAVVPTLVNFNGTLTDVNGKPLIGTVGVTFLLYKDQQGGAPLWLETQNVAPDKSGRYTVMLGSTRSAGLPTGVFVSGEARWLGVQVQGQGEQPRVLLLSVPYALKAGDAQTVGGLPASAFVLVAPPSSEAPATANGNAGSASASVPPATSNVTTTGGTVNTLPLFTTATNVQNSAIAQTGSGATAKIGIGTTAPAATLDVKGTANVEGLFTLPASGTATSTAGKNSQPQDFVASAYNSGTAAAVNQTFQWRAEAASNNTTTPSGTLNLLFGSGTTTPAETGLKLSNKGLFTFATGQTFPGTGTLTGVTTASGSGLTGGGTTGTLTLSLMKTCTTNQTMQWNGTSWVCATISGSGTVTKVATGAGLTGGPITTTGTLSIATGGVTNAMLATPSLTVAAGTALTGGGAVALGGTTTLNLDTTKVPTLAAAGNTFTGGITASSFNGSGAGLTNVNASELGGVVPATYARLDLQDWFQASVVSNEDLVVDGSNLNAGGLAPGLLLGLNGAAITSVQQCCGANLDGLNFWTNSADRMSITQLGYVGIGTTNPYTELHLRQDNPGGLGPSITLMNGGGGAGSGASIDFDGYDPTTANSPTFRIQSIDDGNSSSSLSFQIKVPGSGSDALVEQARISDWGSLIVDSSGNNALAIGAGSSSGAGLEFGGTGSGEGIASCRLNGTVCNDALGYQNQYGLDFYTNYTKRMVILNSGDVIVSGCTYWGNGDHQGSCLSDERLKTNIQPFPQVLERLAQLEPVHFDWKPSTPPELNLGGGRQTGFVAQQGEKIFPEMVSMGKDGYRRVNYGQLPYLLLQGVRELKASNDSLRSEAQSQRKQNDQARAEIAKLRRAAAATDVRLARLDRSNAAKDARIAVISREIEQLRKTQQQMAVLLTRFAPSQSEAGKSEPVGAHEARSAVGRVGE